MREGAYLACWLWNILIMDLQSLTLEAAAELLTNKNKSKVSPPKESRKINERRKGPALASTSLG